jgi:Heterokaryon incompatibility protein (HET)
VGTDLNVDLLSLLEHSSVENTRNFHKEGNIARQFESPLLRTSTSPKEQKPYFDENFAEYVYQPLNNVQFIRLLTLEPGKPMEYLKCRLEIVNITSAPVYHAVSYAWESPTLCETVICDGQTLKVTKSLSYALQRIRRLDASITVWADGICINQMDTQERSHQVKLMQQIYSHACQVFVWLGPDEQRQAANAFDLVDRISRFVSGELQSPEYIPLPRHGEWNNLRRLFSQSWFWRLWVIQEVALADSAIVLWGDQETSWTKVGITAAWMRSVGYEVAEIGPMPGMYNAYLMFRLSKESGEASVTSISLLLLLRLTRQFRCSDPRDRVFALLGLANSIESGVSIKPDYTKSVQDVYREVAVWLLEDKGTLQVLSAVQHGMKVPELIPSWVPQWSQCFTHTIASEDNNNASDGLLNHRSTIIDSEVLRVHGIEFDIATVVTEVIPRYSDPGKLDKALLKLWLEIVRPLGTYPRNQGRQMTLGMAFYEALTAGKDWYGMPDVWRDGSQPGFGYVNFVTAWRWHWEVVSPKSVDGHGLCDPFPYDRLDENQLLARIREPFINDDHRQSVETFGNGCGNRRLFTTARGYIGVGPAAMKDGDLVSVLAGGFVPFVLRKREYWALVGEAYVPGIMRGEAVEVAKKEGLSTKIFEIK